METQLVNPPMDGITAVRFAPSEDLLAVSSWDQVRLFVTRICLPKRILHVVLCDQIVTIVLSERPSVQGGDVQQLAGLRDAPRGSRSAPIDWITAIEAKVCTLPWSFYRLPSSPPTSPFAVLDVCWASDGVLFSGDGDGSVHACARALIRTRNLGVGAKQCLRKVQMSSTS